MPPVALWGRWRAQAGGRGFGGAGIRYRVPTRAATGCQRLLHRRLGAARATTYCGYLSEADSHLSEFEANWKFTSLSDCLRYLGERFPPNETTVVELRTPSGLIVPHRAPKYLYRGECGLFETTESSLTRLERSGLLDAAEQQSLRKVHEALQWRFRQEDYGNSQWNAEGLLQHYGVPTEVVDFSSFLDVAAAFAASKAALNNNLYKT